MLKAKKAADALRRKVVMKERGLWPTTPFPSGGPILERKGAQPRRRSTKQEDSQSAIKIWTLWLSLGAAMVKFVQAAICFFHGDK